MMLAQVCVHMVFSSIAPFFVNTYSEYFRVSTCQCVCTVYAMPYICTACLWLECTVTPWHPITNHLFLLQVSRLYSSQVVDIVRHIHRPIGQGHEVGIGLVKVLPLKCPAISNGTKRKGTDMVSIRRRTKGDGYSSMFHAALSGFGF